MAGRLLGAGAAVARPRMAPEKGYSTAGAGVEREEPKDPRRLLRWGTVRQGGCCKQQQAPERSSDPAGIGSVAAHQAERDCGSRRPKGEPTESSALIDMVCVCVLECAAQGDRRGLSRGLCVCPSSCLMLQHHQQRLVESRGTRPCALCHLTANR